MSSRPAECTLVHYIIVGACCCVEIEWRKARKRELAKNDEKRRAQKLRSENAEPYARYN